jgi:hypothetical protein
MKQKTSLVLIKRKMQTFLSRVVLNEAGPLIIICKKFHLDLILLVLFNCNVHVFCKLIFSNKTGFILETSLFLYINPRL